MLLNQLTTMWYLTFDLPSFFSVKIGLAGIIELWDEKALAFKAFFFNVFFLFKQVSGKDGIPSDSTPTILSSGSGASDTKVNGSAASTTKKEGDQEPHAAFVPPTSSYNYQYPG